MSANDSAGRIHRQALVASLIPMFVLCMLSVIARFYIRIGVQRSFTADDGLVLAGTVFLIGAFATLMVSLDTEYMIEAFVFKVPGLELSSDFLERTTTVQQTTAAVVTLSWCAVASVKFSFLFLFRKLIARVRYMTVYWWFVVLVNLGVLAYGCSVYFVSCPHIFEFEAVECAAGKYRHRLITYAVIHMALDVFTDLLILYIPVRLIWKVQIEAKQKLMLALSLCLSIVMIIATVIRVAGIQNDGYIDHIWETYWILVAGAVGIILTAITAFRSFFVARQNRREQPRSPSWYRRSKERLKWKFGSKEASGTDSGWTGDTDETKVDPIHPPPKVSWLPQIPKPTMTGIRTFINGHRSMRSVMGSNIMRSHVDEEDDWKAIEEGRADRGIMVRHDLSQETESARSTKCYQCGRPRSEHPLPLML